jgi:2-polyprenyl-3-methyl-5-hydroxy-6-metoxy-1,4-benzoquinol methylase
MNLTTQAKKRLPRPVKAVLRPLYRKGYDIFSPTYVLDKKLLSDTMEYFDLTRNEVITIAKARNKLNVILWNSLNPTTDEEIKRFHEITPFFAIGLQYQHARKDQREFRSQILSVASGDCLDYGGGVGDLCLKLAEKGLNVTFGDVPGVSMEFAKWLFKKRGYDIETIDLEKEALSKQYDTIICIAVIQHIPQPGPVLEQIANSLRKGGKLVITDLHGWEHPGLPMDFKIEIDTEGLLESFGLVRTARDWLWVKTDGEVPVERELARKNRMLVK